MLYMEVLGKMESNEAVIALLELSRNDHDIAIYCGCGEALIPRSNPNIARILAHTLKHPGNARANRAAHVVAELRDKTVNSPLIDALVTTQRRPAPPNSVTTAFGSGPQFPEIFARVVF